MKDNMSSEELERELNMHRAANAGNFDKVSKSRGTKYKKIMVNYP